MVFPDDEGQTTAAADTAYQVMFPDGSKKTGKLDSNGYARFDNIPSGVYGVNYEPDIDNEIKDLQKQIGQELISITQAERKEYADIEKKLEEARVFGLNFPGSNAIAQYKMYKQAAATGVWNGVKGLAGFAWDLVKGTGKILYELSLRSSPLTAPQKFTQDLATLKASHKALQQFADEDLEVYAALMTDKDTYQIFQQFGKDYITAQHALEITETGGEAALDIVLTVVTAGAGAAANVRHLKKLSKLKPLYKKLMKLLKRKRAKLNRKGAHNTRLDTRNELNSGTMSKSKTGAKNLRKTPSYKAGNSDGGPGIWSKETTPAKGADYQRKVTGAPKNTEYVVETSRMPSGRKKFDGYDPERNVLIDAKDYSDKWPVKNKNGEYQPWSYDEVVDDAINQAKIGKDVGAKVEWHVPTKEKASEIKMMLRNEGIDGIIVKATPKS